MLGSQGQLLWRAGALPETLWDRRLSLEIQINTDDTHKSEHMPAVFRLNYSVIHMEMFNSSGYRRLLWVVVVQVSPSNMDLSLA